MATINILCNSFDEIQKIVPKKTPTPKKKKSFGKMGETYSRAEFEMVDLAEMSETSDTPAISETSDTSAKSDKKEKKSFLKRIFRRKKNNKQDQTMVETESGNLKDQITDHIVSVVPAIDDKKLNGFEITEMEITIGFMFNGEVTTPFITTGASANAGITFKIKKKGT